MIEIEIRYSRGGAFNVCLPEEATANVAACLLDDNCVCVNADMRGSDDA